MNTKKISEFIHATLVAPEFEQKSPFDMLNWEEQLCTILDKIPRVGEAFASIVHAASGAIAEYREYEFFRKFACFVCGIGDVPEKQRVEFLTEVENSSRDASGNIIMNLVDRLDNINKERILANLVKSRCSEEISITDFFRLASVLERVPYVDLELLPNYLTDNYDEDGDTELLFATGVLQLTIIDAGGTDKYRLSKLGEKLLRYGCHYRLHPSSESPKGTRVAGMISAKPVMTAAEILDEDYSSPESI